MALPRVTPGSYNYGAYANPTPIRYKGGFGEALAGGAIAVAKVVQTNKLKKQQDAAKLNKIKADALDSQLKYKNSLYKANPNPGEQTQQSYNELANMWYQNEVDFKTQKPRKDGTVLDFDGHSAMKNKLNNALLISESAANWVKEKAEGEMPSITQIRESDKDFKLWSRDKALVNSNFNVSYDEDLQPYIEYYEVDFDKYMDGSYKNIDDIPMNKVSMKMSDIFDDKNLYRPQTKYSWEQDQGSIDKYAANLTKDGKAFATGAKNGYRYLTDNNINTWKQTLTKDFSTDIINTRGKQIYEDILVDENGERYGYGSWEGTPEQTNKVKEAFTDKILEKVPRVGDKISSTESKEDTEEKDINEFTEEFLMDPAGMYSDIVIKSVTEEGFGARYDRPIPFGPLRPGEPDDISKIVLKLPEEKDQSIDLTNREKFGQFFTEIIDATKYSSAQKTKLQSKKNIDEAYAKFQDNYRNQFLIEN